MRSPNVVEIPQRTVTSINPFTGELLREYEQHSNQLIESKLQLASESFRKYRKLPFAERARMMVRAAEILEKDKETFGRLMTQEMGKTLKSAIQEAEKCAFGCRF